MADDGRIGELIGDEGRRRDWRAFVAALHEVASPGGPLEGWLFHGTCAGCAGLIADEGVTTTDCLVPDADGAWTWDQGTHWGTPKVAAFYAEDRIESRDDPGLELAIVAARVSDLVPCGPFATDGQTIDCPLYTRLERPAVGTDACWEASDKGWEACLDAFGTVVVLGPVGPWDLEVLRCAGDVEALVAAASLPRP